MRNALLLILVSATTLVSTHVSAQNERSATHVSVTSPGKVAAHGSGSANGPVPSPGDIDPIPDPGLRVLYTGQLYGYFRVPDTQRADDTQGCPIGVAENGSPAAKEFHQIDRPPGVLVGMGDNFAPRLEARQFSPGTSSAVKPGVYGKELYVWVPGPSKPSGAWLLYNSLPATYRKEIGQGRGFLPTDNVACFLIREGYAAVVPGKHDFYFGPERLRELASFLASTSIPVAGKGNEDRQPRFVQMLGANLVLETSWKQDHDRLPDSSLHLNFAPMWPKGLPAVVGLKDGARVYPWLPRVKVKVQELKSDTMVRLLRAENPASEDDLLCFLKLLLSTPGDPRSGECSRDPKCRGELKDLDNEVASFTKDQIHLCRSREGHPNEIPTPGTPECRGKLDKQVLLEGNTLEYSLEFPKSSSPAPLDPGASYGLCLSGKSLPVSDLGQKVSVYCLRFSVYQPLLWTWSGAGSVSGQAPARQDPAPYVFLPADLSRGRSVDVAIFGVVDPNLAEYVGALNLEWKNMNPAYETVTAIEDPAEALKQVLGYFEYEHKDFKGVRILLAQMSPQKAQVLAKRVGGFQVVVSAADSELAEEEEHKELTIKGQGEQSPLFLAVPPPYYVGTRKPAPERVQLAQLTITHQPGTWTYTRDFLQPKSSSPQDTKASLPGGNPGLADFWRNVRDQLRKDCTLPPSDLLDGDRKAIEYLALCEMQKAVRADVALVQERDFYPSLKPEDASLNTQQRIDRVIWKGDFLVLLYVPGSALKKAIEQSKKYKAEETSGLALSDERQRALVTLGIRYDSERQEYFINEAPVDDSRLYAVATTDYIGAGDTGYHDMVAAAVRPPQLPGDFGKTLQTISGLVCQALPRGPQDACLGPIDGKFYFDEVQASPPDVSPGNTTGHQLWSWARSAFRHGKETPLEAPEARVQERGLGALRINPPPTSAFTIDKASLGISALDHKFTEADLANAFPGSPVTQLQTQRKHTFTVDLRPRYSYSWHKAEVFEAVEFRYGTAYQGQVGKPRTVNQSDNLFSSDTGIAFHLALPGLPLRATRDFPHLEPVFTFHYETQLINPLPKLFLTVPSGDTVSPFDTSRTHLLLPRAGLRLVNRQSWIEAGLEDGGELNAVRLTFVPLPPPQTGSNILVARPNIRLAGAYWRWKLVVPVKPSVSLSIDEDGDLFFNHRDDSPTDERFRSDTKVALNFQVWPSLSFAPTFEMFGYSNKVQGIWFWQDQASIQMNVRFDFWNHRQWRKQIQYKPGK